MGKLEFYSHLGSISIVWNDEGKLTRVDWALKLFPDADQSEIPVAVRSLSLRMKSYFADGEPLGPVPWNEIAQDSWTPFQAKVYRALAEIPHGETRTYGWLAERIGSPNASRAVGQALRNNPLPILIPCHRVVSTTSLGGFMGIIDATRPEMDLKCRLQRLEQDYLNPLFPFMSMGSRLEVAH